MLQKLDMLPAKGQLVVRLPLNMDTMGGVVGAILDEEYETRLEAAKAFGMDWRHLSDIINGRYPIKTAKWFSRKIAGHGITRLEFLQQCKAWKRYENEFMEQFEAIAEGALATPDAPVLISDKVSGGVLEWKAGVAEVIRRIIAYHGDEVDDALPRLAASDPVLDNSVAILEGTHANETLFIRAAFRICKAYQLPVGEAKSIMGYTKRGDMHPLPDNENGPYAVPHRATLAFELAELVPQVRRLVA